MEELQPDILKEILSYKTPCELKQYLEEDKNLSYLRNDKPVLYKQAMDYYLPYYEGITLNSLCDFYKMPKEKLLELSVKNKDERIISYIIQPHITDKYDLDDIYNYVMEIAAQEGYAYTMIQMMKLGANNYNKAMAAAARGGHVNIIQWMLNLGADDYDNTMIEAARGGFVDIIQWMLKLGATDYSNTMVAAASGGHESIVQWMIDLGAYPSYFTLVQVAAEAGHRNIIEMILNIYDEYIHTVIYNHHDMIMSYAAKGGHEDIVQWMLDLGAGDYDEAMAFAAEGGHKNIINMLLNYKPGGIASMIYKYGFEAIPRMIYGSMSGDYNKMMAYAAKGGHKDIIQWMIDLGANDYNRAMAGASLGGHEDIVQWMLDLGANDYDKAMAFAARGGHRHIVEWMLDLGATDYDRAIIFMRYKDFSMKKYNRIMEMMIGLGGNAADDKNSWYQRYKDSIYISDMMVRKESRLFDI